MGVGIKPKNFFKWFFTEAERKNMLIFSQVYFKQPDSEACSTGKGQKRVTKMIEIGL